MNLIHRFQGLLVSLIALCSLIVFVSFMPKSLEPYRTDQVYIPTESRYLGDSNTLEILKEAELSLHWPGSKKTPVRTIRVNELKEPTLFVILRSTNWGSRGFSKDFLNEKNNTIELGFRQLVNFVSFQNSYPGFNSILLSVNTDQVNVGRGIASTQYLNPVTEGSFNYFLGSIKDQAEVLKGLGSLIDEQDLARGSNGYNPKNIALLAYYPSIKKFTLLDDSKFLSDVRQDFWYGGTKDYDPVREKKMLYAGTSARKKIRSFPDEVVNQVGYERRLKKVTKFLKERALPMSISTKRKVSSELLKQGIAHDELY
jgi:hypothetical protein